VADSAAGDAGNLVVGEKDKKSPPASASECLWLRSTGFFVRLSLMSSIRSSHGRDSRELVSRAEGPDYSIRCAFDFE